jgi:hypothetical protein
VKTTDILIVAAAAAVTASIAFPVNHAFGRHADSLPFVAAAAVGSQAGAWVHSRVPGSTGDASAKAEIGTILAVVCLAFGLALQVTLGAFTYPEIVLPISVVGSFVFPWAGYNTTFKALVAARESKERREEER